MTALSRFQYDIRAECVRVLYCRYEKEFGTPIYERDWDVLVVLDACRADLMDEVANNYGFIEPYTRHDSMGSNYGQCLRRNFVEEYRKEMAETVMVT